MTRADATRSVRAMLVATSPCALAAAVSAMHTRVRRRSTRRKWMDHTTRRVMTERVAEGVTPREAVAAEVSVDGGGGGTALRDVAGTLDAWDTGTQEGDDVAVGVLSAGEEGCTLAVREAVVVGEGVGEASGSIARTFS